MTTKENIYESESIIVSDGCCVQYGDALAIDDVTFSITKGKKIAVVGPNGGGKSTLFKAIAGLTPLSSGSLKIDGLDPLKAKGMISYIPQKDSLNWNFQLSVRQVVEMGLTDKNTLLSFNQRKNKEKIKESLDQVGILNKSDENINNLSGGQQQRVLLAKALIQDSNILLLDEAFSAIDVGAQEDIMKIINGSNLKEKTILLATHDINNLGDKFDEVLCLNRHCCAFGDPLEVLTEEVIEEMYGSHDNMFLDHKPGSHGS
jgi:ABC-type Mn2+/Zn2+ transport system ATPase subunit